MRHLFFFLAVFLIGLPEGSFAQEKHKRFFFKNFQDTYVYYKDGRTFCVPANYDLVKGSFVFIDKEDENQLKLFGEQEQIGSVKVGERTFLASRFGPTEVLQTEPEFKIHYQPRLLDDGKAVGYGIKSNTSATRTYSHLNTPGSSVHQLDKEDDWVGEIIKVYLIKKNGKEKKFSNEKQFLKIYGKHKKELQTYIKEKSIDFNTAMQVFELYKYAESLP